MSRVSRAAARQILLEQQQQAAPAKLEELSWFIFRFTNQAVMPHSEVGCQGLGAHLTGAFVSPAHALQAYGMFPAKALDEDSFAPVYMISRSRLFKLLGTDAEKQSFQGPELLATQLDTPLNRAVLYLNLLAYLHGARPEHKPKLLLLLPLLRQNITEKHRFRYKHLKDHELGCDLRPVTYSPKMVEQLLAFVEQNPSFGLDKPGQIHRLINYDA